MSIFPLVLAQVALLPRGQQPFHRRGAAGPSAATEDLGSAGGGSGRGRK